MVCHISMPMPTSSLSHIAMLIIGMMRRFFVKCWWLWWHRLKYKDYICAYDSFLRGGRHGICQFFNTSKIANYFNFNRRKCVSRDLFWPKIENGECFTHLFWTIFTFCTQLQTNSSHFVKTYNISSLNSANYAVRLIFWVNFWKLHQHQNFFYTNQDRDFPNNVCQKFIEYHELQIYSQSPVTSS